MSRKTQRSSGKLALKLAAVTVVMFAFGFGLVPLYDVICDVTGLNGKTGRITQAQLEARAVDERNSDKQRVVTVEFVAGLNRSMNWEFEPVTKKLEVHPGKAYTVNYLVRNHNTVRTVGQAVPSVAPTEAARFFNKIECFCFSEQALEANEQQLMPVRFVVDNELPPHIETVSLAYTFFDITDKTRPEET